MARALIWRRLAEEDLAATYLLLGAESPAAAERFLDSIEQAVELLRENPGAGRLRELVSPLATGIRSWVVRRFDHVLFYRSSEEALEIVRILHGARDIEATFGAKLVT